MNVKPWNQSRSLVTGATGFIGGYLARRLLAAGSEVSITARSLEKADPLARLGAEVQLTDLRDGDAVDEINLSNVDRVWHCAAWLRGKPLANFQSVNVDATARLAVKCAEAGVSHLIFISSIAVYGPIGHQNVDETAPLALYGDPYGDSKIRAEAALRQAAEQYKLKFTIVRPGMVYGPGSPGWTVRPAVWAKRGITPLLGDGSGTAYPIYIDNLIDLLLAAGIYTEAQGETFNAVDDGPMSLNGFLNSYMAMIPSNRALRVPRWAARTAARLINPFIPSYRLPYIVDMMLGTGQISNDKAKQMLGWSPNVGLEEGLKRSEAWLRETGVLPELPALSSHP